MTFTVPDPMLTDTVPVYKAGAVMMRRSVQNELEFLITRPIPNTPGERPKLVLPRGSRQYWNGMEWIDARDAATACAQASALEPLSRTIEREMEEEAGLPVALLRSDAVAVTELGVRLFISAKKAPYAIYWVVIRPSPAALAQMLPQTPHLLEPVQWATLSTIETLVVQDDFSAGYMPVLQEVAALG